ncbi:MAG: putative 4-mercaptohistidine N1-methyltransferase [Verrucomicrobiales bacterium]
MNPYESRELVAQYLLFHYGKAEEILPWSFGPQEGLDFPLRTALETWSLDDLQGLPPSRALDIGCAVGRSCFALSEVFEEVIGIDFSQAFIDAAETIQKEGQLAYDYPKQGSLTQAAIATRPDSGNASRIKFRQGDAQKLRSSGLGGFQLVHAANLIDRLPEPVSFLESLTDLIEPGGLLILTSPYTWLEGFTPKTNWIGGYEEAGETWPNLQRLLSQHFELLREQDMPMLIPEHHRKYQWSVPHASTWRRRAE